MLRAEVFAIVNGRPVQQRQAARFYLAGMRGIF